VLGLAEAFVAGSEILPVAVPLMKHVSDKLRVNVGLAVADGDEMLYLHAVRRRDVSVPRLTAAGRRTPIEMTSLGRAYLATLAPQERSVLLKTFRKRHPDRWKNLNRDIRDAVRSVEILGYCRAGWLPGVTSIAAPVKVAGAPTYLVNISLSNALFDEARMRDELVPELLTLSATLRQALVAKTTALSCVKSVGRRDDFRTNAP